jgi:hypothetical protein
MKLKGPLRFLEKKSYEIKTDHALTVPKLLQEK